MPLNAISVGRLMGEFKRADYQASCTDLGTRLQLA